LSNIKYYNNEESEDCFQKDDCISWKDSEEELLQKYNIIYDGHGVHPIKIIYREKYKPIFVIGGEDDGHIWFKKRSMNQFENSFDCSWANNLIESLQKALEIVKNK